MMAKINLWETFAFYAVPWLFSVSRVPRARGSEVAFWCPACSFLLNVNVDTVTT
jgi:hypothetical protein